MSRTVAHGSGGVGASDQIFDRRPQIVLLLAGLGAVVGPLLPWLVFQDAGSQRGIDFAPGDAWTALIVGLFVVARHLRIADRVSMGFGLPRAQFVRELLLALALGILSMLPLATLLLAWELRVAPAALPLTTILATILKGLLSGVAVSVIEETFLRGAMFTAVARDSGPRLAVISTALQRSCFDQQREIQAERMAHLLRARWSAAQPDARAILLLNEDPDLEAWRRFARFVASPLPAQEETI